jgi:hypothetical protein
MHLTLSPTRRLPGRPETTLHVAGDVLTVDGVVYDLSSVPEGGEARVPSAHTGPFVPLRWTDMPNETLEAVIATRVGGVLRVVVRAGLDDTAADDQPSGPDHWVIPEAEGDVTIPAVRKSAEVSE